MMIFRLSWWRWLPEKWALTYLLRKLQKELSGSVIFTSVGLEDDGVKFTLSAERIDTKQDTKTSTIAYAEKPQVADE